MRRVVLGIDPGVSGGIVALWDNRNADTCTLSESAYTIWDWLAARSPSGALSVYACIEKVGGFMGDSESGQKVNKASAHTMFTFGKSYGWLEMALVACGIPHQFILPKVWQSAVGAPKKRKGERQDQYKTRLAKYARELYPDARITKATADAFLIAHYCRRIRGL